MIRRRSALKAGFLFACLSAAACASSASTGSGGRAGEIAAKPTAAEATAAAETLCPVLWAWTKDVGAVFNEAALDVGGIDGVEERRRRWFDAFDEIEALNEALLVAIAVHRDDVVLAPLVLEVERDLPLARAELDDVRLLFDEHPEVDERPPSVRASQVAIRLEKVIDLPKPALGSADPSGDLVAAFQVVPSCQHSIKDVDDGRVQANG